MKKKYYGTVFILAAACLSFAFCSSSSDDENTSQGIFIEELEHDPIVGTSLKARVGFENGVLSDHTFIWTSYNEQACVIEPNGTEALLHFKERGTAVIEVVSQQDKTVRAEYKIDVRYRRVPLVIVAGQSNADGRAPLTSLPENTLDENNRLPGYMMWNKTEDVFSTFALGQNTGAEENDDTRFSFDIFFANKFLSAYPEDSLWCIRQTIGGVPITEKGPGGSGNRYYRWTPDASKIPAGEKSMCEELATKYARAQSYALGNKIELVPIAVLFHQGEGDANREVYGGVDDYAANLTSLIAWFRTLTKDSGLLFINGDIMYGYSPSYAAINQVIHDLSGTQKNYYTVDMSDHQTSIGDNLHYDATALEYLGKGMYSFFSGAYSWESDNSYILK